MAEGIEFPVPVGVLGRFLEKLVLARCLHRLIETRHRQFIGPTVL